MKERDWSFTEDSIKTKLLGYSSASTKIANKLFNGNHWKIKILHAAQLFINSDDTRNKPIKAEHFESNCVIIR